MSAVHLFPLAVKYLLRYRKRYFFLFLAMCFGFMIISVITPLKAGMTESLYQTAQSHYAGDVMAIGYDLDSVQLFHLGQTEIAAILQTVEDLGLNPDRMVRRTNVMGNTGGAQLYHNGAVVAQKYVSGVDWQAETAYFDSLVYENPLDPLDDDSILVSAPVAKKLNIRQGDSLILELLTKDGERNTGFFVVAGIIKDASIFGYFKSYVSKKTLNDLLGYEENDCSMIGLYYNDKNHIWQKQMILHTGLANRIAVSNFITNREEFRTEMIPAWSGIRTFVLTLDVYLSEVAILLDAMNLLSYFLYALMLLIIFVSALVTYRLILYERTKELATMRIIGFNDASLDFVLIMEMACLVLISLVIGFFFACLFNKGLSQVPLDMIPSFAIFMRKGKLVPVYQVSTILVNAGAVFCVLLFALGFPLYFASRKPLPQMLGDNV